MPASSISLQLILFSNFSHSLLNLPSLWGGSFFETLLKIVWLLFSPAQLPSQHAAKVFVSNTERTPKMKKALFLSVAMIATSFVSVAQAQSSKSPFATTDQHAHLKQRSTIVGDYNSDYSYDYIDQRATADIPAPGGLNPHAEAFLAETYGDQPAFSYDMSFVNQMQFDFGNGNSMSTNYASQNDEGSPGYGGIDKKVIIADQVAIQNGYGNNTELRGKIRQTGRPTGAGRHGDILDLNVEVINQVGVQIGDNNNLDLSLETEQSDR